MNFIPTVFERTNKGDFSYDIYSKFLKERKIFLNGNICEENTNLIIMQMLYLDKENPNEDIIMYINSNGGDVYCGMAIYDIMHYINSNILTICIGNACSMAAFILSSGTQGKRYSFPNSRIMIHQPMGGAHGQASDIKIHAKEILYLRKKINIYFSKNTNKSFKKIKKNTNRDYFMSPLKALNYGIIDHVLLRK